MNQVIFLDEVEDWLVDLIYTSLFTSLGLKICQKGTLDNYTTPEDITGITPAVLVEIQEISYKGVGQPLDYIGTYRIRVVYIAEVALASDAAADTNSKMRSIGELIINNSNAPTFSQCFKVLSFVIDGIDKKPSENAELKSVDKKLKAAALECTAVIFARRS